MRRTDPSMDDNSKHSFNFRHLYTTISQNLLIEYSRVTVQILFTVELLLSKTTVAPVISNYSYLKVNFMGPENLL